MDDKVNSEPVAAARWRRSAAEARAAGEPKRARLHERAADELQRGELSPTTYRELFRDLLEWGGSDISQSLRTEMAAHIDKLGKQIN